VIQHQDCDGHLGFQISTKITTLVEVYYIIIYG